MHSLPRRISLFAFMIVVAAICLVCGIYKFWVFPPMLRVDVPSANQVVVDGNVLTLLDAEAVIAKYAKQQRDGSKKAFMKITVNENLAAPQRSALADKCFSRRLLNSTITVPCSLAIWITLFADSQ